MPIKKNTNKLSQLYRTIDQKELSKEALDTLAKLRLATGNFRKQEGKEVDAFKLFFDRLIKNKPTAVKTTPEYKAMIKERRSENGRKAMEARKAKQESRQGQGSEEDAKRPAKPFGWRLKGKHNYRKPTRADISSGKAYYEARINRADSKRTKFPMLERGGFMAKGGGVLSNYKIIYKNDKGETELFGTEAYNKAEAMKIGKFFENVNQFKEGNFKAVEVIEVKDDEYADGGFMEHGGDVDKGGMIYALREFVSSGEIANKTDVLNYDDIAKIRRIAIQYYMDNGDVPYSYGELAKVLSYANDKFKSGMMAKGGVFYSDSHKLGHE
jgi:hypothetical protein